jgi:hypothetical protein
MGKGRGHRAVRSAGTFPGARADLFPPLFHLVLQPTKAICTTKNNDKKMGK